MKLDLSNRTIRQHEKPISHSNFWRILGDMVIGFLVVFALDYLIDQLISLDPQQGLTIRFGLTPLLNLISTLASSLFSMGIMWGLVRLVRHGGSYDQGSLVQPFKEKLGRNILALFLLALIGLIPTIVVGVLSGFGFMSAIILSTEEWQGYAAFFGIFILAGIILGIIATWLDLSLAMVSPLLGDYPEMGAWQVMKESFRMMKGNRWELLGLILTYIWIPILIVIVSIVAFFAYAIATSPVQGPSYVLAFSLFFFALLVAALIGLYYSLRLNVAKALFYTALEDKEKGTSCFPGQGLAGQGEAL